MVCPSIICPATSAPSNTSILRTSTWHTFSLQSYTSWLEVSHGCHLSCSLGNFSYLSLSETFPMFSETWETPFLSSCAFLNLVDPSPWGVSSSFLLQLLLHNQFFQIVILPSGDVSKVFQGFPVYYTWQLVLNSQFFQYENIRICFYVLSKGLRSKLPLHIWHWEIQVF